MATAFVAPAYEYGGFPPFWPAGYHQLTFFPGECMAVALESIVKQLTDSGIIAQGQLENFIPPKAHPKSVEELVAHLVKGNHLTKFQAAQVAAGKSRSLILGEYTILNKIGAGGMGQVFKALHRRMDRLVAIKMLPPAMTKDAAATARFEREVRAAAKLSHPNIVAAHDAGHANGVHFLVMEYVDGQDLSQLVKKNGPFPVAKAVNYVLQAARGLEFAHSEGVVHRDIKPANLLLDKKGTVKILDMGLARIESQGNVAAQAELTGTGAIMGTVDYMAPEQGMSTKHADARADIYSLGCSLYYLIAGKATYDGETMAAKLLAHHTHAIPDLRSVQADVADDLEAVFKKMVAKKIEDRYQSMTEVISDLDRLGRNSGTVNDPYAATAAISSGAMAARKGNDVSPSGGKQPPWKNTKVLIGAGAAGFLFLLLGVIVIVRNKDGKEVARLEVADGHSVEVQPTTPKVPIPNKPATATPARNTPPSTAQVGSSITPLPTDQTFNGHRYQLVKQVVPWDRAKTEAEAMGGYLATISSKAEDDWIRQTFGDLLKVNKTSVWLGASQATPDAGWKWVTDEPFVYTNWGRNEPNCRDSFDENQPPYYLNYYHSVSYPTKLGWNDSALGPHEYWKHQIIGYLVEWDAPATGPAPPPAKAPFDAAPAKPITDFNSPEFQAWMKEVQAMPAEDQVKAVSKKLMELNPGFDGKLRDFNASKPKIQNGVVTGLELVTDNVTDLSPLRALEKLEQLNCHGSGVGKGKLYSLSPLKGMSLTHLDCWWTQIVDLSPLQGMPLVELKIGHTPITDLSPLKGMRLEDLRFPSTKVVDISALSTMPLNNVVCEFPEGTQVEVLRSIKTLKNLNYTPLDAFLRDLVAEKQLYGVMKKMQELNPQMIPRVYGRTIEKEVVTGLHLLGVNLDDLTPLRSLPGLRKLDFGVGHGHESNINLSGLQGLPLTWLSLYNTHTKDFSPLRGMPLTFLNCSDPGNGSKDHSFLKELPMLSEVHLRFDLNRDYDILRSIKTLTKINGKTAEEFLAEVKSSKSQSPAAQAKPITDFKSPEFLAWIKEVQAMPAEEQAKAVSQKMMELNPGFDGKLTDAFGRGTPKIEDGVVTEIGFSSARTTDISPVRALAGLKYLKCSGESQGGPGERKLTDLSPLSGMQLKQLDCTYNYQLSDLSPLKELPLIKLFCFSTSVSDLSPIQNCKSLQTLRAGRTKVTPAQVAALQKALPNCKIEWDDPAKATTPQPAASGTK